MKKKKQCFYKNRLKASSILLFIKIQKPLIKTGGNDNQFSYSGFVLLILILFGAVTINAQQLSNESELEIGIIEHLDEYLPLDEEIINTEGESVSLSEIIDKPTVLNFVYYRCPGICTPLMDGIADVVNKSDMVLGKDYQIVTISFDPREGTELAKRKKNNYSVLVKNQNVEEGWHFFTADSSTIDVLTKKVGFRYKMIGNEYVHSATIIMISPKGKITRYLNGTFFLPLEFKLALTEASKGQSGPTINKILQYCFSYDPAGQKYVLNIKRVSGIIIVFITVLIFLFLSLKPLFKKRKN